MTSVLPSAADIVRIGQYVSKVTSADCNDSTILPAFHAASAIASGGLLHILPEFKHRSVDVHALYPSHRSLSAKVRVFIDELVSDRS